MMLKYYTQGVNKHGTLNHEYPESDAFAALELEMGLRPGQLQHLRAGAIGRHGGPGPILVCDPPAPEF